VNRIEVEDAELRKLEDPATFLRETLRGNPSYEVLVGKINGVFVTPLTWLIDLYTERDPSRSYDWHQLQALHDLGYLMLTNSLRVQALSDVFPELEALCPDPPCSCTDAELDGAVTLYWVIIHLNDRHSRPGPEMWSRDRIADWVATLLEEK
jgi:hypothetical protein